jgi:hypothetical protein
MIELEPAAKIDLGIGIPAYGAKVAMWTVEQWIMLGYALANTEQRFTLKMIDFVDVCGVEVARNRLMQDAIEHGCSWLLTTDADTWHVNGFEILQMISTADRQGAAVVAAPTPRRGGDDVHLMVYRGVDKDRRPLTKEDLDPKHGPLVEIDSAATAMMAINLNFVMKHMKPPWFRFEWVYGSLDFNSEDHVFCRRIQEAGGKIMATTGFIAKHLQRPQIL